MRVITKKRLNDFIEQYPDAKISLKFWYNTISENSYFTIHEVLQQFRMADYIGNERFVFNIAHNKYRLIVKFRFHPRRNVFTFDLSELIVNMIKLQILKIYKILKMKKFPSSKYLLTPITDEETYLKYCDLVEELDDMEFDSEVEEDKKFAYLDAMTTLLQAYEAKNFAFNKIELTLVQVIEQALEQLNFSRKDLVKILGANRVSEIFSGKRQLTLAQIRILHKELRIPTDILVGV